MKLVCSKSELNRIPEKLQKMIINAGITIHSIDLSNSYEVICKYNRLISHINDIMSLLSNEIELCELKDLRNSVKSLRDRLEKL